jgi:hypothetical protein
MTLIYEQVRSGPMTAKADRPFHGDGPIWT